MIKKLFLVEVITLPTHRKGKSKNKEKRNKENWVSIIIQRNDEVVKIIEKLSITRMINYSDAN